jgi:signal transduction histidine kinase
VARRGHAVRRRNSRSFPKDRRIPKAQIQNRINRGKRSMGDYGSRRESERRHISVDRDALAHDFRNLVQCALSALRVARRLLEERSDRPAAAAISDAMGALERSVPLARTLASPAASPDPLEDVCIPSVILSLRRMLRHALDPSIRLDTLVSRSLPSLRCPPGALENALVNLVVNARDSIDGPGTVVIEARQCMAVHEHEPGGTCLVLAVTDTGCGMPPEIARQAFRRLFTTKGPGPGQGLGLASVRAFVERLGGSAEIRSAPGAGTTVRLHLPAGTGKAKRR